MKSLLVVLLLFAASAVEAATCPGYPYALTNYQVADADQVMANFNNVLNCVNNNVLSLTAAATNYAPLISPALAGTPTAPTATPGDSSTQLATDAFVASSFLPSATAATTYAPLISPALTGTPTAPTASPGTNTTQLATTAFDAAAVLVAVPNQSGHAGQYLSTNGTSTSWAQPNLIATWANVACTGSGCTVTAGQNVSSVTRNSAGNYTVNFTNAYGDTNYAPFVTSRLNIFMSVTSDATGSATVAYTSSTDGGFSFMVVGS